MTGTSDNYVFSHITVGATDLDRSTKFYDTALAPLGIKNMGPFGETVVLYGKDEPVLLVLKPRNGEVPSSNGVTIGFAAATPADADAFHTAGLAAGGTCDGPPGPRESRPNAYAAYLRDPDGNKLCAFTYTPA